MIWGRVEVTPSFLLLLAWLNYMDREWIVPQTLLACTLHELGHYAVIRAFGNNVSLFRLTVIGADMRLERPMSYGREILCALAGPAVNLALALVVCRIPKGEMFAGINLMLGAFNLIPAGNMDGGRILACLLEYILGPYYADRIREVLHIFLSAVLLSAGTVLLVREQNCTLFLVAVWLSALIFRGKERNRVLPYREEKGTINLHML